MNDDAKSPSTGGMGQCIQKTSPNDQKGALGHSKKYKRIVPLALIYQALAAIYFYVLVRQFVKMLKRGVLAARKDQGGGGYGL
jgi:hypothetical protein